MDHVMPASQRRRRRDVRRSFTREDKISAERGLGRHCLGLDSCSPGQRRFRALLALHLFNRYEGMPGHVNVYSAHVFLSYTMIASPEHDRMVFIVPSAVRNAFGRLISSPYDLQLGMPGLRLVVGDWSTTFHAIHLPTDARVVFASRSDFEPLSAVLRSGGNLTEQQTRSFPFSDVPLSEDEQLSLDRIPPMTTEIETLLAALVVRISARDPRRTWDIGNWWGDPLRRPQRGQSQKSRERFLWGSGDRWTLRWNEDPYPEDLLASLTHPEIGVAGASSKKTGSGWAIRLGRSELSLDYTGSDA